MLQTTEKKIGLVLVLSTVREQGQWAPLTKHRGKSLFSRFGQLFASVCHKAQVVYGITRKL